MGFYASDFMFNNIPSETYGLQISTSDGGESQTKASGNIQIIEEYIFRRNTPYIYGVSQNESLEFNFEITTTQDEITEVDASFIQAWLFGKKTPGKLQIVQPDMSLIYFEGFFTGYSINKVGNIIRGFSATFHCTAPWGWEYPKTITKTYNQSIVSDTFFINNTSDNDDYTYPTIEFTMNYLGGKFMLGNVTDLQKLIDEGSISSSLYDSFSIFENIGASEKVIVDFDRKIISSYTLNQSGVYVPSGLHRINNFNLKWFRLLPKINAVNIVGSIASFKLTYQNARKVN